jgi:hypothetical protein
MGLGMTGSQGHRPELHHLEVIRRSREGDPVNASKPGVGGFQTFGKPGASLGKTLRSKRRGA